MSITVSASIYLQLYLYIHIYIYNMPPKLRLRKHRVISPIHTILEEAKVKVGQDPELVAALVDAI